MAGWQFTATVIGTAATVTIAIVAVVSLFRSTIRDLRAELETKVGAIEIHLRELETSTAEFRGETNAKLGQQGVDNLAARLENAMKQGSSS